MTWRLHSKNLDGEEGVAFASTRQDAIAKARALLVGGQAISRIESEDGEILEGKQLQEALIVHPDRGTVH